MKKITTNKMPTSTFRNLSRRLILISIIAVQFGCGIPYRPIQWPAKVEPSRFALLNALQDHAVLVVSYDILVENDVWDFAEVFDLGYVVDANSEEFTRGLRVNEFEPRRDNNKFFYFKLKPDRYRALGISAKKTPELFRRFERENPNFKMIEAVKKWRSDVDFSGFYDDNPPLLQSGDIIYVGSYQLTIYWQPIKDKETSDFFQVGKYEFVEEMVVKDCYEKAKQELEGILGNQIPQVKKIPHLLSTDKLLSYNFLRIGEPSRTIEKMQPCEMQ